MLIMCYYGILGSSRNKTPRLSVSFNTSAIKDNTMPATPSRREPRQAAQKAIMKIVETSEQSPEEKSTPRTRRKTIATVIR